jgi:hypothetical protein
MTSSKLAAAIAALPDSKDKLLDLLKKKDIKGSDQSGDICADCLLARYFSNVTGETCSVGLRGLTYVAWSEPWSSYIDELPLNEAACQVAFDFDHNNLDRSFYT